MNISMLKGKLHRATVKQAELDYVGSITVDPVLLEAAGILEYEHVHIVDVKQRKPFSRHIQFQESHGSGSDLLKRTCSTLRGNRR